MEYSSGTDLPEYAIGMEILGTATHGYKGFKYYYDSHTGDATWHRAFDFWFDASWIDIEFRDDGGVEIVLEFDRPANEAREILGDISKKFGGCYYSNMMISWKFSLSDPDCIKKCKEIINKLIPMMKGFLKKYNG